MSTKSILSISQPRYNCPACGAHHTVPQDSLYHQPSLTGKPIILVTGTCEVCGSSRTQWKADLCGNRIDE